jgi:hypothetical protein
MPWQGDCARPFFRECFSALLSAQTVRPASRYAKSPYAPYEFLIGEWNIAPDSGGPSVAVARFRWGPNHSYIWYAGSLLANGEERPHFEGLLVWNGVHRNLDMLLALDLESGLVSERRYPSSPMAWSCATSPPPIRRDLSRSGRRSPVPRVRRRVSDRPSGGWDRTGFSPR